MGPFGTDEQVQEVAELAGGLASLGLGALNTHSCFLCPEIA